MSGYLGRQFLNPLYSKSGATYYVDATLGNDTNSGKSWNAPWQTLAKVNATTLYPGDSVSLKRGEVWLNQVLTVPSSGAVGKPIIFGAYGTGANPLIDGSITLTGWAVDVSSVYKVTGITATFDVQRALFEDGIRLTRATSRANVNGAGKWFLDAATDILYAWSTDSADPDTHTMKFTNQRDGIYMNSKSYLEFDGIDTTMQYLCGYNCRDNGISSIKVKNAHVDWVTQRCFDAGGISKVGGGGVRVTWHDYITFEDCTAHDSVGEAFYMAFGTGHGCIRCTAYNSGLDNSKGYAGIASTGGGFSITADSVDCYIIDCTAYATTADTGTISVEYVAAEADNRPQNTLIDSCWFRTLPAATELLLSDEGNNTTIVNCLFQGGGGVTTYMVKLQVNSNNAKIYHNTFDVAAGYAIYALLCTNAALYDNIFYSAEAASYAMQVPVAGQTGFVSNYNVALYQNANFGKWGASWYSFANWRLNTGQELNSQNADPVFVTPGSNYHLQAGSPCEGQGFAIGVAVDKDNVTRVTPPTIGCYEFV